MLKLRNQKKALRVLILATAVVFFWRGMWGLMDLFIFPENNLVSYILSLVVGIVILSVTHHLTHDDLF